MGAGARVARTSKQKTNRNKTKRWENNSEDPESGVLLLDKPGSSWLSGEYSDKLVALYWLCSILRFVTACHLLKAAACVTYT